MTYGLDLAKERRDQEPQDHIAGVTSVPCQFAIPFGERKQYLPMGEVQKGREDFQDCATRSPINELEAKFTYALRKGLLTVQQSSFLAHHGYLEGDRVLFSDAYIAIKSGTTRTGNSLKAPLDAIHRFGLIPKAMLPAESWMTWEQYHDAARISPEMDELGDAFLDLFGIYYERVYEEDRPEARKSDMIGVAGFAWPPRTSTGIYPRTAREPNHAFLDVEGNIEIFDNYEEEQGDFIKQLAPDYKFLGYGYRVYVGAPSPKKGLLKKLLEALQKLLYRLTEEQAPPAPVVDPERHETPVEPRPDYIHLWALGTQQFEGWNPGSHSFRMNNPGNLKKLDGTFIRYPTYEAGFAALKDYLTRACTGRHASYDPSMVLFNPSYDRTKPRSQENMPGFFSVYAPDGPVIERNYATFVAKQLGVTIDTVIGTLV